ncbi:GPN-loop GTPase 2 [Nowakowskiella sp. JEL0407]|nr:GPN-loop GTPase 2 [Nowakowskiella sp. JEL0407]
MAKVHFGQFVVGPPGAGKSTYCNGLAQFLRAANRPTAVVNLDPANDLLPYECDIDIRELVTLEDVAEDLKLGPNGGLMYCMEYLEENLDWLLKKLDTLDKYILFDCPGQVELYTHHSSMKNILEILIKKDYRICTVHLIDAHYCTDAFKYISAVMLSLQSMIQLETPHINVLSKVDLIEQFGKTAFNLDFYTEVQDLSYLLTQSESDAFGRKHMKLTHALCELISDFSLVGFQTLCIEDKLSVAKVVKTIDKANGFIYGYSGYGSTEDSFLHAMENDDGSENMRVQEKWMSG